jgi:galactoside O-acetyltransferase
MNISFYSNSELENLGFKSLGNNVLISRFARFYSIENIEIGSNVRIDDFCILSGHIKLGSYIHISPYSVLYGRFGIQMEDCSGLSPRCTILSASDDFGGDFLMSPMSHEEFVRVSGGKVILRRFVQVGAGSIIMPNVTINEGVAIGALSFVKHELEPWKIYGGNPIRFIKERNRGLVEKYNKMLSDFK